MEFATKRVHLFIGKKRRGFEIDYFIFETKRFSLFLTRSTFVLKKGLERLRLVFWLGRNNQITKQIFLWQTKCV